MGPHSPVGGCGAAALAFLCVSMAWPRPSSAQDPTGSIVVSCPRACMVTVDGEARGTAPVIVPGLTPGSHLVETVYQDGTVVRGHVSVPAGGSAPFASTPDAGSSPAAQPQDPPPPAEPAAAVEPAETQATDPPTEDAAASPPTTESAARTSVPARGAGGAMAEPPADWRGNASRRFMLVSLLLIVPGLPFLAGGVVGLVFGLADGIIPLDGRATATGLGSAGVAIGIAAATTGIVLLMFGGPSQSDRSGTVYFAGARPYVAPIDSGAVAGAVIPW